MMRRDVFPSFHLCFQQRRRLMWILFDEFISWMQIISQYCNENFYYAKRNLHILRIKRVFGESREKKMSRSKYSQVTSGYVDFTAHWAKQGENYYWEQRKYWEGHKKIYKTLRGRKRAMRAMREERERTYSDHILFQYIYYRNWHLKTLRHS